MGAPAPSTVLCIPGLDAGMTAPDSGYLSVGDGKLYYEVRGVGSPLVLIHAGFLDRRMWDEQFVLFARDHRVIRYDVRGFGRSDRPHQKYSDSADLLALVDHLGVAKATLIGVSNGGRISLDFVVEHPDRVEALILVAPGVGGYESSGPTEDALWEGYEANLKSVEEAVKAGRVHEGVKAEFDVWTQGLDLESRRRLFAIALDNAHLLSGHPREFNVSLSPPAFQRLSKIQVPTLLIVGDLDTPGMMPVADKIHARIRHSKKLLIPGADHIINMSKAKEFNRAVLEFLAEGRGRR